MALQNEHMSDSRRPMSPRHRRVAAVLATALMLSLSFAAAALLLDQPLLRQPVRGGRGGRAALAIRDNVPPWQKWITKVFTLPHLRRCYGRAVYFTQSGPRDSDRKQEFQETLRRALEDSDEVDLFLLSHGNNYCAWVRELDPQLTHKLRLVYNTGCVNAGQGPAWLQLGADTYIGHPGWRSASCVFYVSFMRRWCRGTGARAAMERANAFTKRTLARADLLTRGAYPGRRIWPATEAQQYGESDITITH